LNILRLAKATVAKYNLQIDSGSRIEQIGKILIEIERILVKDSPDTCHGILPYQKEIEHKL